jgi:hypothetical protein
MSLLRTLDRSPVRRRWRAAALAAAFALGCVSCVELRRTPGVMFATSPPGARVMVDGVDSGFVTPCHVDLSRERHDVDMVLEGYKPVSVAIDSGGQTTLVFWDEAWIYPNTWRFPLWLNARDGFFPVKVERGYSPARIYAPLKLAESQDAPRRGRGRRNP